MNALMNGISPGFQFIFFIMLVLTCMGMGSVAAMGVGVFGFGIPLEEIASVISVPQAKYAPALMWMNNVSQLFTFLVPVIAFIFLFGRKSTNGLMLRTSGLMLLAGPLLIVFAGGIIELSSQLNKALIPEGSWIERSFKPMEDLAEQMTTLILNVSTTAEMVIAFFSIAIIPAICEEFAFRGVMQPLLAKMTRNKHLAIWITAIVFSLFHMQFYGFIPRVLLGALLGYLVIWSGSLWTSVFAHFVNNAMAFFLYKVHGSLETPEGSVQDEWYTYVFSTLLFIAILYFFLKKSRWKEIEQEYLYAPDPGFGQTDSSAISG